MFKLKLVLHQLYLFICKIFLLLKWIYNRFDDPSILKDFYEKLDKNEALFFFLLIAFLVCLKLIFPSEYIITEVANVKDPVELSKLGLSINPEELKLIKVGFSEVIKQDPESISLPKVIAHGVTETVVEDFYDPDTSSASYGFTHIRFLKEGGFNESGPHTTMADYIISGATFEGADITSSGFSRTSLTYYGPLPYDPTSTVSIPSEGLLGPNERLVEAPCLENTISDSVVDIADSVLETPSVTVNIKEN